MTPPRALSRLLQTAFAFALLLGPIARAAPLDDPVSNKSELIRGLLPTVVNILVKKDETKPASPAEVTAQAPDSGGSIKAFVGSGFVIDPSGIIVTNYHVIENAFDIIVSFNDGSRLPGKVTAASRLADLALVKVDADHPLAAAHWGNSDTLQVGDQVLAAGNPFGLGLTVTAGIVSATNRDIQDSPYDDFIQTDAPINHGNSGGPLFDMQGAVVGVNSTILSPTTGSVGLGFAIPASSAHFVVDQLRAYGWVHPGWLGVKIQAVTPEIANAMGAAKAEGSLVSWVISGGPADKAGLHIGDIILGFNDTVPTDDRALLRDIAHTPEGDVMILHIKNGTRTRDVSVTVEAWPRNQWDARDAPAPVLRPKIVIPPNLGLTLAPLSDEDKQKNGLTTGLTGVMVTSVSQDTDSIHRGITSGDVILRVQDTPVSTPDEVQAGIDAARAAKRAFVLMLVLPKVHDMPGPRWMALKLNEDAG